MVSDWYVVLLNAGQMPSAGLHCCRWFAIVCCFPHNKLVHRIVHRIVHVGVDTTLSSGQSSGQAQNSVSTFPQPQKHDAWAENNGGCSYKFTSKL